MIATQMFATPTAGVVFDNSRSSRSALLRLANITGTGDVRLSGTPTGLTASSGFPWMPTHGLAQEITVPAGDALAVCANATQVIAMLYGTGSP